MPLIDVREDYTKRQYGSAANGYEAELEWTVAYPGSEVAAVAAVATAPGGCPGLNAPHPFAPALRCVDGPRCREFTFNFARVRAVYRQVQSAVFDGTDPLNPQVNPPRLRWHQVHRGQYVDRDQWGNPITNSAGDPFRNPASSEASSLGFTITRPEPIYNPVQAVTFVDAYNSAAFAPMGIPALLPGQCRCCSILPLDDWVPANAAGAGTAYQMIAYVFDCQRGFQADPDKIWDAWRYRVLDAGTMGWFTDPADSVTKRGVFCDGAGNPLSVDVLLDGTGKPIDPTVRVSSPTDGVRFDAVSNPKWTSPPKNVYVDSGNAPSGSAPAKWITYDIRARQDFNAFKF